VIVFLHHGPIPLYLSAAVLQAKTSNPGEHVVLLSDQVEGAIPKLLNRNVEQIQPPPSHSALPLFRERYRHDGGNSREYEQRCFERWFHILDWVEARGDTEHVLYLDSDALLFLPLTDIADGVHAQMTVCNEVGPQFTFFRTPREVRHFTDFLLNQFKNDSTFQELEIYVREFAGEGLPHVSDMAALGLYGSLNLVEDIGDPSRANFVFCENIGSSQGLKMGVLGKAIRTQNGRKYFVRPNGSQVLAGGVHLQGGNKVLWPFHVSRQVHAALLMDNPWKYANSLRSAAVKAFSVISLRLASRFRRILRAKH